MPQSSLDGHRYDVIVCGGGCAGIAAACAAAWTGASTLLLERYGFCGGTPTAAMIHTLDAVKSCRDTQAWVVGGFAGEIWQEIQRLGGAATEDNPPEALSIHPEMMKIAADRLLARAGVEVVFHAHVCDAIMSEQSVAGVTASLRDGRADLRGNVVVDATGDAEIAFLAGAPTVMDQHLQALTYHFRLGNVKGQRDWGQMEEVCRTAMTEAYAEGAIGRYGGPWIIRLADGEVSVNATRVVANPVDPRSFSAAEAEGREQMHLIWRTLRERVPELASSYILSGATQLHVRESRKIVGDYVLTAQDIQSGARFEDAIAVGAWPVDIHPTNGYVGVHPHKENPPHPYEIPYRCLLPKQIENLLVPGRPLSTTHEAHGSTRVPGTSMATGQAAGVAAALAALSLRTPRSVPASLTQEKLRGQGAIVTVEDQIRV